MALAVSLLAAAPAAAAHKARLSADLADHWRAGRRRLTSSSTARGGGGRAGARYNVRVKRYLKSGAVLRVTAGAARRRCSRTRRSTTCRRDIRDPVDGRSDGGGIGADQVWAGSERRPGADGRAASAWR